MSGSDISTTWAKTSSGRGAPAGERSSPDDNDDSQWSDTMPDNDNVEQSGAAWYGEDEFTYQAGFGYESQVLPKGVAFTLKHPPKFAGTVSYFHY